MSLHIMMLHKCYALKCLKHCTSAAHRTHEVVEISLEQMDSLCGNTLELCDARGVPVMAMSTQVRIRSL